MATKTVTAQTSIGETTKLVVEPKLNTWDRLIIENIAGDLDDDQRDREALDAVLALNNPKHDDFEPTLILSRDYDAFPQYLKWVLRPYIGLANAITRRETDVVMASVLSVFSRPQMCKLTRVAQITHLLLYTTTTVPSALYLFHNFTWTHGIFHIFMQLSYLGAYSLMMHQHIHVGGILKKKFALLDKLLPYLLDPLFGHTWNTFYWHHVKHHHVEGNGPDDLSSTIRFERDNPWHFALYTARFAFLVSFDLPIYFIRKGHVWTGLKVAFWEFGSWLAFYALYCVTGNFRAVYCTILAQVQLLRLALMVNNWGQHAFVDEEEPTSDYRSSITVIDGKVSVPFQVGINRQRSKVLPLDK